MIELCGCGHANDHHGKRCGHPINNNVATMCPCQNGQRVDVATFRAIVATRAALDQHGATLMRLLAVMEIATGLQSSLVPDGKGGLHVEVVRAQPAPTILIPGH